MTTTEMLVSDRAQAAASKEEAHVSASESETESEGEHQHDEHCTHGDLDDAVTAGSGRVISNRNEKKARKLLSKMGLRPLPQIKRVTFKRGKIIFAVSNAEVFRVPGSEQFIIFGEAKVENESAQMAQMAAAAQQQSAAGATPEWPHPLDVADSPRVPYVPETKAKNGQEEEEEDEAEDVDVSGLDEKDIKIVMEQASVSRNKAIRTLKASNGDIVNAIMELSM